MSEEKLESKSVTVPKLTKVTPTDYLNWRKKFQGFLAVKGAKFALTSEGYGLLPTDWCEPNDLVTTGDANKDKKIKQALKSNDLAMAYFNLALENERAKMCIEVALSKEYPDGKAKDLMDRLDKKFRPNTGYECEDLRDKLRAIKVKENDDPSDAFEKIAGIRNLARELGGTAKIEDEEVIARLFTIMPAKYHNAMKKVIDDAKAANSKATLDDMETAIIEWYLMFKPEKNRGSGEDEGTESALTSFTGKCYTCGKSGHRAFQCKQKQPNDSKSNGKGSDDKKKCFVCGKKGHLKDKCFELEKNKDKRPKNWKSCMNGDDEKKEKANAAQDIDKEVMLTLFEVQGNRFEDEVTLKEEDIKEISYVSDAELACLSERIEVLDDEIEEINENELVFMSNCEMLNDPELWVGDSGATVHVSHISEGVVPTREAKESDKVIGNAGNALTPEVIGNKRVVYVNKEGEKGPEFTLQGVYCSENYNYNLFSLTQAIGAGWKLSSTKDSLMLKKGNMSIIFDIKVKSANGVLFCARLQAIDMKGSKGEASLAAKAEDDSKTMIKKKTMNIKEAHCCFGHMSEANTRKAAKEMGIEITRGSLGRCVACAIGKAKQKNVPKNRNVKKNTSIPGERIHLDLSRIAPPEEYKDKVKVTRPVWRLMVDEATTLMFSDFFDSKSAMIEPTCAKIQLWKSHDVHVRHMRFDNAGENRELETIANGKDWKLGIIFEYTGKETPQRNSLAEVGFSTTMGRSRSMMRAANIPLDRRHQVCKECIRTATLLDGLRPVSLEGKIKSKFEFFLGQNPRFAEELHPWGEAGVVKTRNQATAKIEDRGKMMMFVGYNTNSGADVFRMWDPDTNRVHNTRDILWLGHSFFEPREKMTANGAREAIELEEDKGEEAEMYDSDDELGEEEEDSAVPPLVNVPPPAGQFIVPQPVQQWQTVQTRSGRTIKPPSKFRSETGLTNANYYAALQTLIEEDTADEEKEYANVGAGIGGGFSSTDELHVMSYEEAMETNEKERTKHIDVRLYWLRDLKEKKIIKVVWCSGKDNEADLFTKNLGAVDFHKYADRLLRDISEVKKVRFSEEVEEISNVVSDEDDLEIREAVEMRFTDQSDQRKVRNSGLV